MIKKNLIFLLLLSPPVLGSELFTEEQTRSPKSSWTGTFLLRDGTQVKHTARGIEVNDKPVGQRWIISTPKYNGLRLSNGDKLEVSVRMDQESFVNALQKAGLYKKALNETGEKEG